MGSRQDEPEGEGAGVMKSRRKYNNYSRFEYGEQEWEQQLMEVTRSYEFYHLIVNSFMYSNTISNLQMTKQPQRSLVSKVTK